MSFADLNPGDSVVRVISDVLPMPMTVVKVEGGLVYCNTADERWAKIVAADEHFWMFDVVTGAEVDDDLSWGPKYGRTGSKLVR